MNKNEAAYLAPIVKAFGDGKDVQFESEFEQMFIWVTDPDPTFNPSFKWRVKPEPREFWVIEHEDKSLAIYTGTFLSGAFKVREVLDDD